MMQWRCPIIYLCLSPFFPLVSTYTHRLPLLSHWQDLNVFVPSQQFLLMGLQTTSCFHLSYWFDLHPSHCLSWAEILRIYHFCQVEEAVKKKKKIQASGPSFQSWTCSEFSVIFKFNKTPYSHCCYKAKLNYTDILFVWSHEGIIFFQCCFVVVPAFEIWCAVFRLGASIHHIYWL